MVQQIQTKTQKIRKEFEKYVSNCYGFKTDEERHNVKLAFEFAFKAHEGMVRYSGEPYITHCFEVAKIVTQGMGLGAKSAIAALLHDVIDKTEYDVEDIRRHFGDKVTNIIIGIQKIKDSGFFSDDSQASSLREILLSMSDDIRVILVKLADRLDCIRTINFIKYEKQKKIVDEILKVYSPLAHRLGLYSIKTEMEDLCLKFSHEEIYHDIESKLKNNERERLQFINRFAIPIRKILEENNISFILKSRSKSIYSIYKKMQTKKVSFDEVYDLFAIRIIFKSESEKDENKTALKIGELVSSIYEEKEDRRRNWLYNTKETGYQSLHLTVLSNEGKWAEVQIRSEAMDQVAEYGMAAHWKYKGVSDKKIELDQRIGETLKLISNQNGSAAEFLDSLKLNIFTSEIFVFTPHGHVITLPKGSTVLDFAFKIHTELAFKCIAAKINSKTVSLDKVLQSGDKVQIITSNSQFPRPEWQNLVITQKAILKLNEFFKNKEKEKIEKGKVELLKLLNKLKIKSNQENITKITDFLELKTDIILFKKIYQKDISQQDLEKYLIKIFNKSPIKYRRLTIAKSSNDSDNIPKNKFEFEYAACCNPNSDEQLKGYRHIQNHDIIIVHRLNCEVKNLEQDTDNPVAIVRENYTAPAILTGLRITGRETIGFVNSITSIISKDLSVNMKSIYFHTEGKNAEGEIMLYIQSKDHIDEIINKLKKIESIIEIVKINPSLKLF